MERLLEKLRLYDILSSVYAIPVAYFIGVIFNECGNLIYRLLCRLLGKNILL